MHASGLGSAVGILSTPATPGCPPARLGVEMGDVRRPGGGGAGPPEDSPEAGIRVGGSRRACTSWRLGAVFRDDVRERREDRGNAEPTRSGSGTGMDCMTNMG